MKLVRLSCDNRKFKTLDFNPTGLTLIVGDSSDGDGNSNGVGKTFVLDIVHLCLGGKANPLLASATPDWVFTLELSISNRPHCIERSGDGKRILLDGKSTPLTKLRAWLDSSGVFSLRDDEPYLSFRSLITRFARLKRDDYDSPIRTSRETPFQSLLRTAFLLGMDLSLIRSKERYKKKRDELAASKKNWKTDKELQKTFRAGTNPKIRLEWLDQEIARLSNSLEELQVAENYRALEIESGGLTMKLREIGSEIELNRYRIEEVDRTLQVRPDISKADLMELYSGLEIMFKEEVLHHFEAVEKFHNDLSVNRSQRLEGEKLKILVQIETLEARHMVISEQRDALIQSLQGKRALDEYAALAEKKANLNEEKNRLNEYLDYSDHLENESQLIGEKQALEARRATEYINRYSFGKIGDVFRKISDLMYPNMPAGIVAENNVGDNQTRYNLSIDIEGDGSDGINSARVVIFDYMLLLYGSNHNVGFLWHDNRLFAHMAPLPRAKWFEYLIPSINKSGKQYIASINKENYVSMLLHVPEGIKRSLEKSVKLTLLGDREENKLLGIQFGKEIGSLR